MDAIIYLPVLIVILVIVYFVFIYPNTNAGKEATKRAEQERKKLLADLTSRFGKEMVDAAQKKKILIGMHADLIKTLIAKPKEIRDRVTTAESVTEVWFFKPLKDAQGKPLLDKEGLARYDKVVWLKDEIVEKIEEH